MIAKEITEALKGLSHDAMTLVSVATLACLRAPRAEPLLADVRDLVGFDDDRWQKAYDEAHSAGVAWLTGDSADNFDRLQTSLIYSLLGWSLSPTNRPKASAWLALREEVFQYQFYDADIEPHCAYCKAEGVELVLDHLIPLARGGSNHFINLIPACVPCNSSKGSKYHHEWRP